MKNEDVPGMEEAKKDGEGHWKNPARIDTAGRGARNWKR